MKYVILGGTGTLGGALIDALRPKGHPIVCFSRDELKQQEMRRQHPEIRYVLGDIRDAKSLVRLFEKDDIVFHVAALKHVDVLEANPTEAIKTNVLGTINVAEAAIAAGVRHVVFSSTDKAVLPINTYGMTKAISERYLLNLNEQQGGTKFAVFRWGNVVGSRGSVIHSFVKSLKATGEVFVTDSRMTRFWIHIQDAVNFMLDNFRTPSGNAPIIPPMKAAQVVAVAQETATVIGAPVMRVRICGIRPGEKIHETIYTSHDHCVRSDTAPRYSLEELRELLRRSIYEA